MSATATVVNQPPLHLTGSAPAKKTRKRDGSKWPAKSTAPVLHRKPSPDAREHLHKAAAQLLREEISYTEAVNWLRAYMIRDALRVSEGNKRKAAAMLGISRDHLRDFFKRCEDLMR